MIKFEQERITDFEIKSVDFKFPISAFVAKPKQENDNSVVFVMNPGIGSTNGVVKCMGYPVFDNHWFISYEKAGHGSNKNQPSQFKRITAKELDAVIEWIKANIPNRKIYLLGESWGSQINMYYYHKYFGKVNGMVNWNAPFDIQDPDKHTAKFYFEAAFKNIATLLFNANCTIKKVEGDQTTFTNNLLMRRALRFQGDIKGNTRATINVWRHMSWSYHFMKKYGKDSTYNFLYIQSGEDILSNKKKIQILKDRYCDDKHLLVLTSGKHVLSFEPVESDILYKAIDDFIKR